MKQFKIYLIALLVISCSNDDTEESKPVDPIIGTWTEVGSGIKSENEIIQFNPYDYFCVTLGRFSFKTDGSFKIETFNGPDDGCFSTGVITGTWENQGVSYLIKILTDSSETPETGQQNNLKVKFPDSNTMRWILQSDEEGMNYSYEEFTKVE